MKNALIFNPYLDTLGGGERYTLSFALGLIKEGYKVEIAWNNRQTLEDAEVRFGFDLSDLKLNKKAYTLFTDRKSFTKKFLFTIRYSLIFWVSDGSLPFLFSKNNLIHFQVPFKSIGGNAFVNSLKSIFIHKFVYNSIFTANVHEKHFPKSKTFVLYPPIDSESFVPGKKENTILSVARFDSPSHSKRQDILIEAFKILNKKQPEYQLLLVGGNKGDSDTLEKLKKQADNLPVKFVINPDFNKLKDLYSKSRFFWHAAGYEVDEKLNPEKVEHFGMTTVEAMSAGCIPIVIAKGGQKEIIAQDTGILCNSPEEMAQETAALIEKSSQQEKIVKEAIKHSENYSIENFNKGLKALLS